MYSSLMPEPPGPDMALNFNPALGAYPKQFPSVRGGARYLHDIMLVRCHLFALTGLIWTDVGQARLPDVHAKLMYIIEPPESSSEAWDIAWHSIIRQQITRLNKLKFPRMSISLIGIELSNLIWNLRRNPEDNQQLGRHVTVNPAHNYLKTEEIADD